MGAIDEISGDGKGALLAGAAHNTSKERRRAQLKLAAHALTTSQPAAELRELLAVLGLDHDD
jgi:hypothetical protein